MPPWRALPRSLAWRVQPPPRSRHGGLTRTLWPPAAASLAQTPAGARAPPWTRPSRLHGRWHGAHAAVADSWIHRPEFVHRHRGLPRSHGCWHGARTAATNLPRRRHGARSAAADRAASLAHLVSVFSVYGLRLPPLLTGCRATRPQRIRY